MAVKAASPDQILEAEKPIDQQPFAVDIAPPHHGQSKFKKDNDTDPGGKKKQGAGIGDYFVSALEFELVTRY